MGEKFQLISVLGGFHSIFYIGEVICVGKGADINTKLSLRILIGLIDIKNIMAK